MSDKFFVLLDPLHVPSLPLLGGVSSSVLFALVGISNWAILLGAELQFLVRWLLAAGYGCTEQSIFPVLSCIF